MGKLMNHSEFSEAWNNCQTEEERIKLSLQQAALVILGAKAKTVPAQKTGTCYQCKKKTKRGQDLVMVMTRHPGDRPSFKGFCSYDCYHTWENNRLEDLDFFKEEPNL